MKLAWLHNAKFCKGAACFKWGHYQEKRTDYFSRWNPRDIQILIHLDVTGSWMNLIWRLATTDACWNCTRGLGSHSDEQVSEEQVCQYYTQLSTLTLAAVIVIMWHLSVDFAYSHRRECGVCIFSQKNSSGGAATRLPRLQLVCCFNFCCCF